MFLRLLASHCCCKQLSGQDMAVEHCFSVFMVVASKLAIYFSILSFTTESTRKTIFPYNNKFLLRTGRENIFCRWENDNDNIVNKASLLYVFCLALPPRLWQCLISAQHIWPSLPVDTSGATISFVNCNYLRRLRRHRYRLVPWPSTSLSKESETILNTPFWFK